MNTPVQSLRFSLHPALLHSIIREQSGRLDRALTELVMNSADAGAKEIHIRLDAKTFHITDDGKGFESLYEIDNYFGTFGTPHVAGDARYARFRLGRGVCFGVAKTEWRSGYFGMSVDIGSLGKHDQHGYERHSYESEYVGCEIKGEFYTPLSASEGLQSAAVFDASFNEELEKFVNKPSFKVFAGTSFCSRLLSNICMMDMDIYINGLRITGLLKLNELKAQTEHVAIYHEKSNLNALVLLNQGVYIATLPFKGSYILDFKIAPELNMARNQINTECAVYRQVMADFFAFLYRSYIGRCVFARHIDLLLVAYLGRTGSEIDRQFVDSLSADQTLELLKVYEVYKVTAQEIEIISALDAVQLCLKDTVYMTSAEQNQAVTQDKIKRYQQRLQASEQYRSQVHIIDTNSLMAGNAMFLSYKFYGLYFLLKRKGLDHLCYPLSQSKLISSFAEFNKSTFARKAVAEPVQDHEYSALWAIEEMETMVEVTYSAAMLKKNQVALGAFRADIAALVDTLRDMCRHVSAEILQTLPLSRNDLEIIPVVVLGLEDFTDYRLCELEDGKVCLAVTEKGIGYGIWVGFLMCYLLGIADRDSTEQADIYEGLEFNKALHDHFFDIDQAELFDYLSDLGNKVSVNFKKKKIRSSHIAAIRTTRNAWEAVFQAKPELLEGETLKKHWDRFSEIGILVE